MKKLLILLLVFVLFLASCAKKNEEYDLNLLTVPAEAPTLLLNPHTLDVLPYNRDNTDVEALIKAINELKPEDITSVEYINTEDDTPFVSIYIERESTYMFHAWSLGEGKCGARLCTIGADYNIYLLTFESESIAMLIESIYGSFEG